MRLHRLTDLEVRILLVVERDELPRGSAHSGALGRLMSKGMVRFDHEEASKRGRNWAYYLTPRGEREAANRRELRYG